jgi:hypothetical protein
MTYGLYKAVIETQDARMSLYSYGDNEEEIESKIREYIGKALTRINSIKKVCKYELLDGARGFEVKEK